MLNGVVVRPATPDDAPAIAGVFGRAFDDYRHGLGVSADALARLWQSSLADIVIAQSCADLDPRMPKFVTAFLEHVWS